MKQSPFPQLVDGRLAAIAAAILAAGMTPTASATDYSLPAGQSKTLSTEADYDTMTVEGDLTVSVPGGTSNAKKFIRFTNMDVVGGSVTVDSAGATPYFMIGYTGVGGTNPDPDATVVLTNNAGGAYASLSVKDMNAAVDTSLCCQKLYLRSGEELDAPANGILDFARIENGALFARQLYNESSCTGRVTIAGGGTSYFCRRGRSSSSNFIEKGPFIVRLEGGSLWYLGFWNNRGSLNKDGETVVCEGVGDVLSVSREWETCFRKGAVFNNVGYIKLQPDGNKVGYYTFEDSEIVGPNITNFIASATGDASSLRVTVANEVVLTVKDVDVSGHAYLTGTGGMKIDAAAAARSFKANIEADSGFSVEKTGANEVVVSSTTNLPNLVVSAGMVRFTDDCVVGALSAATNTAVVADGCEVTLPSAGELVGVTFETINGGRFVFAGSSRTVIYAPDSVPDAIHVADGELVFSGLGLTNKFWRFTFTSVNGAVKPLALRGLYLFADDGTWQNQRLEYVDPPANENTATPLSSGKVRWYCNSETNVASESANYYQKVAALDRLFHYSENGNHYPMLTSPLIDPDNPKSHLAIEMRLSDEAKPITGYNLRTASNVNYANGWRVEVSDDGITWTEIEERTNQVFALSGSYPTYDNVAYSKDDANAGELFRFSGYVAGGLSADPAKAVSAQVDDGATLDLSAFTEPPQKIDAITIDLAAGGGTIRGGAIAAGGVLNVVNASQGFSRGTPLPLVLDGVTDAANFAGWTVVVDGVAIQDTPKLRGDGLVVGAPPTVLSFR